MTKICIYVLVTIFAYPGYLLGQTPSPDAERLRALEEQLLAAQNSLERLQSTIDGLVLEVAGIQGQEAESAATSLPIATDVDTEQSYLERILVSDLGHDERDSELEPRPELFVQTRYHANPIDEATSDDVTRNFGFGRMELRWAGRATEKVGVGFEIQYHPAPDGAAEELVNDAYAEYYPNDAITFRVGQFVKPFGFDIQHSSSVRESPERGIFSGYFFPGQRDRGLMMAADLGGVTDWLSGTSIYAGVFNGNRFFDDNNSELNYNFRVRKVFDSLPLAVGASLQLGTQILPPGVAGNDDENVYGIDVQYVVGRLGIRAEYVRGNMPSTLLGLEPEFAPSFSPGEKSSGATAFFNYNLTGNDDIYWRWDRFDNDPVTGRDIRATNLGYLRKIGPNSRISIDYQFKDDVTFNDDELNTKLSITWNLVY
jgi:hypothetical protein